MVRAIVLGSLVLVLTACDADTGCACEEPEYEPCEERIRQQFDDSIDRAIAEVPDTCAEGPGVSPCYGLWGAYLVCHCEATGQSLDDVIDGW